MRKLAAMVRSMPGLKFERRPRPLGTRSGRSVRALNVQDTNVEVVIVAAVVVEEEDVVSDAANRRPFR